MTYTLVLVVSVCGFMSCWKETSTFQQHTKEQCEESGKALKSIYTSAEFACVPGLPLELPK